MLLNANKAINSMQGHIESMMRLSSRYGKKMGQMGTAPWSSAPGAAFARKTAEMMAQNTQATEPMLGSIMRRAERAGMSSEDMERMNLLAGRVRGEIPRAIPGRPKTLQWL